MNENVGVVFAGSDPIDTFVKAVQTLHAHKYKQYGDAAAKTKYGNSALLAGVADPGGISNRIRIRPSETTVRMCFSKNFRIQNR